MKSYCIKINNEKIIHYLLDKIEQVNFENLYYCDKKFEIYKNVIIHYTGENMEKFMQFVAYLVSDTIIEFYEEKILARIISSNYFYFDDYEKKIIIKNAKELCKIEYEEKKENLYKEIKEYIEETKTIVLEGIVNFRIR